MQSGLTTDSNRAGSSSADSDQSGAFAVLDALVAATPGARRIDTHANVVFLIGSEAYKLKRAVRFPFLDYSTLALRRAAVSAEVRRNRLFAPAVYLGETAVTRAANGSLELGGSGESVEPLVHMRRFDETTTLDRVAAVGPLPLPLVERLAAVLASAHAAASIRAAEPWLADLSAYVSQNDEAFRSFPELFRAADVAALTATARAAHHRLSDLILSRGRQGLVRLAHGDAHLANVALVEDEPVLFDAIEFDDAIATGDVLYDLAFALMDLVERGQPAAACHLLNRYLDLSALSGDGSGLAALPLYISVRAAIRAKIAAASIATQRCATAAEAQRHAALAYFDLARRALEPATPRLIAIGGLSGTGKTTLARAFAPLLQPMPGARVIRSDVERKRGLGLSETQPAPPGAYTPAASAAVYAVMLDRARAALAAGHSVILDAVYAKEEERAAVQHLAGALELPFTGIWLEADPDVLRARVSARTGDASDASADTVTRQLSYDCGAIEWHVLAAGGDRDDILAAATALLEAVPPG